MIAWRICKKQREVTAFDGKGAADYPGRWNQRGQLVVYLAESRALASLEVQAHVEDRSLLASVKYITIRAEFDDACVHEIKKLPEGWNAIPAPHATAAFGGNWYNMRLTLALKVPSAVVKGEYNFLLNTQHPDFKKVRFYPPEPFVFDPRIARENPKNRT